MNVDKLIDATLREMAEEQRAGLQGHPTALELSEYREGRLPERQTEALEEHLAVCPRCTASVFAQIEKSRHEASGFELSPKEIDASWQQFHARLTAELAAEAKQPTPPAPEAVTRASAPSIEEPSIVAPSVATPQAPTESAGSNWLDGWMNVWRRPQPAWAVLALVALSAGFTALVLRDRPAVNVVVANLTPEEAGVQRAAEGIPALGAKGQSSRVVLILDLADLRPFPAYRLEVRRSGEERLLWRSDGAERGPFGNFTLELPSTFLAAGDHTVTLYGLAQGAPAEPLARYSFRLEVQANSSP